MKSDKLNLSNTCRSRAKMALLAILIAGCAGMPSLNADDSRTAHAVLARLSKSVSGQPATDLAGFAQASHDLFANFFDTANPFPYATHRVYFIDLAGTLKVYLDNQKSILPAKVYKEAMALAKELFSFIKTIDAHAQPIIVKGASATNADIVPLSGPLKPFSHLIPDAYVKNITMLLNAIRHRLSCS